MSFHSTIKAVMESQQTFRTFKNSAAASEAWRHWHT